MFKQFAVAAGMGLKAFFKAVPSMLIDTVGLGGVGLISYGAWSIYPPAGFIVGGFLVLAGAIILGTKVGRK